MIKNYRKKPVVIQAMIFEDTTERIMALNDELGLDPVRVDYGVNPPQLIIETLEGKMRGNVGDYIIKGVKGEFYACKPDIFEQTYEEVAE